MPSHNTCSSLKNPWHCSKREGRGVPGVMVYLIRALIGWVGEVMYGLRRQSEAPSYADFRSHPLVPLQFSYQLQARKNGSQFQFPDLTSFLVLLQNKISHRLRFLQAKTLFCFCLKGHSSCNTVCSDRQRS